MPTVRSMIQTARPSGFPDRAQFAIVERELGVPDGGALVENLYLSVDPYMRQLMDGGWPLNEPLGEGRAIGRVIATDSQQFREGTLVYHTEGWSTHAAILAGQDGVRVLEPADGIPLTNYLSVLGGTGLTAYVGVREILRVREGENVFITAAAGAVGGVAGQICRLLGAGRVIGSVGSAGKVRHVTQRLGFDAAFDYHDGPVAKLLAENAPRGVDATLDGVGGDHLEAAIESSRELGRIAWVGGISYYNQYPDMEYRHARGPGNADGITLGQPPAPRNLYAVHYKSLTLRGYMVRHHLHLREEAHAWLIPHLRSGALRADEQIVNGFEDTVGAFLGMLRGDNIGKTIVQIGTTHPTTLNRARNLRKYPQVGLFHDHG
jgi:NADPH-dependent curcumin reductase CurA